MGSWKRISFQNISCYCLTQLESERWEDEHISKHLMLLFNDTMYRPVYSHIYISKHLMLLFNFAQDETDDVIVIFQNISCYCLTTLRTAFSVSPFPFQNISCYCLTLYVPSSNSVLCNFKTSHVIV